MSNTLWKLMEKSIDFKVNLSIMKIKFDISKGFVKTKEINSKEKSKNKK